MKDIVLEVGTKIPYSFGALVITHLPCHICGGKSNFTCERCDEYMCENCQAPYNQFSQIDYNCCDSCYNTHRNY